MSPLSFPYTHTQLLHRQPLRTVVTPVHNARVPAMSTPSLGLVTLRAHTQTRLQHRWRKARAMNWLKLSDSETSPPLDAPSIMLGDQRAPCSLDQSQHEMTTSRSAKAAAVNCRYNTTYPPHPTYLRCQRRVGFSRATRQQCESGGWGGVVVGVWRGWGW